MENILGMFRRKSSIASFPSLNRLRDLIKTFAKFAIETKNQLKEKKSLSSKREKEYDTNLLKQKLCDFIKNNFKEKGYKSDPKVFFLLVAQDYYRLISMILSNNKPTETYSSIDIITGFLKQFYDFEDELYISDSEIVEKVNKDQAVGSYLMSLLTTLSYMKICDVIEYILDKENEIPDIGVKTVLVLEIFHKILKQNNFQLSGRFSLENYNTNISVSTFREGKEKVFIKSETQSSDNSNEIEAKLKKFRNVNNLTSSKNINYEDSFLIFIERTANMSLPYFVKFLCELLNEPEMRTIFLLISSDDLSKIFNDLSKIKIIRKFSYDIFIKVNICTKEGIKLWNFRKYILENNCLEGILSSIKNNYFTSTYDDLNDIFRELMNLLIICSTFFESQKDFKNEVFNFLYKIFEDLLISTSNDESLNDESFYVLVKKFISEIFYLSYVDKDDLKPKLHENTLHNLESNKSLINHTNNFKDYDILEFLLNLFYNISEVVNINTNINNLNTNSNNFKKFNNNLDKKYDNSENTNAGTNTHTDLINNNIYEKIEFIRKIILTYLLDNDININKYKNIINQTNYCKVILENLHNYSEELISYPFNSILLIIGDMGISGNNIENSTFLSYVPEKEIKSILKNLIICDDEVKINIILKNFKLFFDFYQINFQKLFINCGFLNILKEIFDKTINISKILSDVGQITNNINLEENSNKISNKKNLKTLNNIKDLKIPTSPGLLIKFIEFLEIILYNNQENIQKFKSLMFLDNYFEILTQFSEYKSVSYKIWNLSINFEQDNNEILKYTKFLSKRYQILKETIMILNIENIQQIKSLLEEIFSINEIISLCYKTENFNKIILNSQLNMEYLKLIFLDFIDLIISIKNRLSSKEQNKFTTTNANFLNNLDDININTNFIQNSKIDNKNNLINMNISHINNENKSNNFNNSFLNMNNDSNLILDLIDDFWDIDIHLLVKNYLKLLLNMILKFNQIFFGVEFKCQKLGINDNSQTRKFESFIKKNHFREIIKKILIFYNNIPDKNYLNDIVYFLAENSLKIQTLEKKNNFLLKKRNFSFIDDQNKINFENMTENLCSNLTNTFKQKYKLDDDELNNVYINLSNYSNFILQSPFIVKIILNNIIKDLNNLKFLYDYIEFIYLLCQVNENNIKLLLKARFLKLLLIILDDEYFNNVLTNKLIGNINSNNENEKIKNKTGNNLNINNNISNYSNNINNFLTPEIEGNINIQNNILNNSTCNIEFTEDKNFYKNKACLEAIEKISSFPLDLVKTTLISKILEIIELCAKFFDKKDIDLITEHLYLCFSKNKPNYNILERLVNVINKNLKNSKKNKKGVILSPIITRQPSFYNMLFTGNIKFFQEKSRDFIKPKLNYFSILISLKFHRSFENSNILTLFKLERDIKDKDIPVLEAQIENGVLKIKENENKIYSFEDLSKNISLEKSYNFGFIISKESNLMEIYLNEKLISAFSIDYKYLEPNSSYNLTSGYACSNTREINYDAFNYIPHVTFSYFLIYNDKLTSENLNNIRLSEILTGKNGSCASYQIKRKNLTRKAFKMIAPNYHHCKEKLKYIRIGIEPKKVIYELIPDNYDLFTNNEIYKLKSDSNISNNMIFKIQRKYYLDINEKDFLIYIPNTNILNDDKPFFNNTYLLGKINEGENVYLNEIFQLSTLKSKIKEKILKLNSHIDFEILGTRFLDNFMAVMFECKDNICFNALLDLLNTYMLSNINEMVEFCEGKYLGILGAILYKKNVENKNSFENNNIQEDNIDELDEEIQKIFVNKSDNNSSDDENPSLENTIEKFLRKNSVDLQEFNLNQEISVDKELKDYNLDNKINKNENEEKINMKNMLENIYPQKDEILKDKPFHKAHSLQNKRYGEFDIQNLLNEKNEILEKFRNIQKRNTSKEFDYKNLPISPSKEDIDNDYKRLVEISNLLDDARKDDLDINNQNEKVKNIEINYLKNNSITNNNIEEIEKKTHKKNNLKKNNIPIKNTENNKNLKTNGLHVSINNSLFLQKEKNSENYKKIIDCKTIDILFNISIGIYNIEENKINFFNPLFPKIITEIIFDLNFFRKLDDKVKIYIIEKVLSYFNQSDYIFIMNEINFEIKVNILTKMFKILMLIPNQEEVDQFAISLIIVLLEQILKFKKGESEPTEIQLKSVINSTQEFILIAGYFNDIITSHLKYRDFDSNQLDSTSAIVRTIFKKLFEDKIKVAREMILATFTKIWEDLNLVQMSLNIPNKLDMRKSFAYSGINKLVNLLNPSFFLKLYNKEINNKAFQLQKNSLPIKNRQSLKIDLKKDKKNDKSKSKGKDLKSISKSKDIVLNIPKSIDLKNISKPPLTPNLINNDISKTLDTDINKNSSQQKFNFRNSSSLIVNNNIKNNTNNLDNLKKSQTQALSGPNSGILTNNSIFIYDNFDNSENIPSQIDSKNENISDVNSKEINYLDSDDDFNIDANDANIDIEGDCSGNDCRLCNLVSNLQMNFFNLIFKVQESKKLLKKYLYYQFIKSYYKSNKILEEKSIEYSWYVFNHEGPARIRNKLIPKMDAIKNEELNKKYYINSENLPKIVDTDKRSNFDKFFTCMKLKKYISQICYLDQIFRLNFIKYIINQNDEFIAAYNCLLVEECHHIDAILIIGKKQFYIISNLHLDKEGSLTYSKQKFRKIFWVLNDYDSEWDRTCPYLTDSENKKILTKNKDYKKFKNSRKKVYNKSRPEEDGRMYKFHKMRKGFKFISFNYDRINEIHKRRFLMKHNSLEIFLKSGRNFYLCLNVDKRDIIFNYFIEGICSATKKDNHKNLLNNNLVSNNCFFIRNSKIILKKTKGKIPKNHKIILEYKQLIDDIQDYWEKGIISNFNYLMILNTVSGRSYNDISQYIVMPWTIKDYSSEGLNLNNYETYRDLTRPIHAIDDNTYKNLSIKYSEADEIDKFHSGSHYSSPGFVCYFLIRLKPFSYISSEIQGGYFDIADRLFNNIRNLWDVNIKNQELIPEMFYLPELFVNHNDFDFGTNQNSIDINDVNLPIWAKNDPRLFVKMNKKALESTKVSEKLSEWIDLIFGIKQYGKEAIKALNIFRPLCYEGKIDLGKLDDRDQDDKMVEIHDFGQVPIQLFTKSHNKKERHLKSTAFFSKSHNLINFKEKEKSIQIQMDSFPENVKLFSECENYMSYGEGGITSFLISFDNEEKTSKYNDATNTLILVGHKKHLLGPKFVNYIDWSNNKFSFSIVFPLNKMSFFFNTYRQSGINTIKSTKDGKRLIIAFEDGVLRTYRIMYDKKCRIYHPDHEKKKEKSFFGLFSKKENHSINPNLNTTVNVNNLNTSFVEVNPVMSDKDIKDYLSYEIFNNNIANQEKILFPMHKFYSGDFKDYYIHYNNCNHELSKSLSKGTKNIYLKFIKENKFVDNPVNIIEMCECYSILILVDITNTLYLCDLNKFEIIRKLKINKIIPHFNDIISVSIDNSSGDFILVGNLFIILFNINGVILAVLDLRNYPHLGKITTALIKSIINCESDIHLFTGHQTGEFLIWRLKINEKISNSEYEKYNSRSSIIHLLDNDNEIILDSYRFAYDKKYFKDNLGKKYVFKLEFDENYFTFPAIRNCPLKLLKLTEDNNMLITIHEDLSMNYWSYQELLQKKNKNKLDAKVCPQCNGTITSSKNNCTVCKKKICSQCKIVEIVPEVSLKISSPVCNDCFSLISSTNKLLYDF